MSNEQLREALQRIQYKAVSLADAQVIALEALALPATPPAAAPAPAVPQGNDPAWTLAAKVREALDRKSCPGYYMDVAVEAVVHNYTPAAPSQPAVPQDSDPTSKEQYRRMFGAACEALGAISDALGCDPEDGGAEPILGALEELQISLGLSNGILGCLSAAQALQEGEPVMWVMRAHETGQLEPARPHQKAKHPKIWSDAFPLYVAQSQPVTLTDSWPFATPHEVELRLGPQEVVLRFVTESETQRACDAIIAALREKQGGA